MLANLIISNYFYAEVSNDVELSTIIYVSNTLTFIVSLILGVFIGVLSVLGWYKCHNRSKESDAPR